MLRLSGRKVALSLPRRLASDLVRCARSVPLMRVERRLSLGTVAEARADALGRPGWCAVFIKAFALVASGRPELRRAYIPYPIPHLYEHPTSIASVAVLRPVGAEEAVFFVPLRSPELQTVRAIDVFLRRCQERPLEDVAIIRRILQLSRWPLPLRCLWWGRTQFLGTVRARHLGTFSVGEGPNLGAVSPHLLTPTTSAINYGVIAPDGSVDVSLSFDQRVLTPGLAVRVLEEMGDALNGPIAEAFGVATGP